MIKSLTEVQKQDVYYECNDERVLEDNEFILHHALTVQMGPCIGCDCTIWSHNQDLEMIKNLYQNVILWEFVNALCYNGNIDDDRLNLLEMIDAKEQDFDFYVKNQAKFDEFKKLVRKEPNSFEEFKEYVDKTSKFLKSCDVYCEAKLYKNFDEAFDDILELYDGKDPKYSNKIDYLNGLTNSI